MMNFAPFIDKATILFYVRLFTLFVRWLGLNIQIKIRLEYRVMLPRPRLVCPEAGLGPQAEGQVCLTKLVEAWAATPGILHRS